METIKIKQNKTKKDIIDERKDLTNIANDIAKNSFGEEDAAAFMLTTNSKLLKGTAAEKNNGMKNAREFTAQLLLLCLYQEIEKQPDMDYITDFANAFDDGNIENGNSKEYIASKITGADAFQANMFIPAKVSKKSVEAHVLQMYNNNSGTITLHPKAYQFKKPLTLQESLWLPYFKSGELGTFINELKTQMTNAYKIFKYNKLVSLIIDTPIAKTIAGTATNMFDCFSSEILPEIRRMKYLNTEFNQSTTSKYVHNTNTDDLIFIMSASNVQTLQSGIKSQLFSANLLNIGTLLNEENIVCLGNKLILGNSDSDLVVSADEYVDNNTIYAISKQAIKSLIQIDKSETQSWAENLTIQLVLHIWGVMDFLPWGQAFKYTNPNLSKLPGSV